MKMFSDCSGECCICACGNCCLAGHGDDDFCPASSQQIIERLNNGEYPNYRDTMIGELAKRGVVYVKPKMSEWISVDERLPDTNELCLLSMENRITRYRWIVIGYYHTNYDEYVTHWQPLPAPPQQNEPTETQSKATESEKL